MKMYILVKESIPLGFAVVAVAHASLAAYLKYKETENIKEWLDGPFYKVVCKVSDKEFDKAKELEDNVVITESALNNEEVAIAYKPREEWPKEFKFYRLYK
ncbi:MAG: peptidyl-tRNA hydrolase [Clostridia bacterium]|nr:peptidyl-tRNA hydrolase [Clostridia bacterium]